ncbi:hypothetical protein OAJ14_04790 [Polaribacter sp.]|nr:hypothetical protein [Polaribacter sp.]
MMKNILKYITVLTIVLAFTSCEEESNFKDSTVELTPVYSITDITGPNAAFKVNIYKQKNLITEYSTKFNLKSYSSSALSDTSTATNYEVTVNKSDDGTTYAYVLSADKTTGDGTLTIDGNTVYTVKVSEVEVYN